ARARADLGDRTALGRKTRRGVDGGRLQVGRALREERRRAQRDADERGECTRLGQRRDVYHHDTGGSDRDNRREEAMTNAVVGLVTCSSRTEARRVAKLIL